MIKYLHRPFQNPDYKIISDCPQFLELLYLQYGSDYINDVECENSYKITVIKSAGRYIFEHNAGKLFTNNPLLVFDDILFDTTSYDDSIIPLHGAAVEYGGQAYIFLAPTTSGKTTLTSYLINNGLCYITEDCILLDKQTFGVYPYPCPVHMRIGGLEVLKKYGITLPDIKLLDLHTDIRYVYTPSNCIKTLTPLGKIFFITRSKSENCVIDMNISENIMELMKSGMTTYQPTAQYIKLLAELARTSCKRLIYCDMEYVRDMIIKGNLHGNFSTD